jgi:hypothetical protein
MFKMLRLITKFLGCLLLLMLASCSVVMAARKEGVSLEKVQGCRTRGQFLSSGAIVISNERLPCGGLVEVYQFQKERGSAARALMHGVLDVGTFGLWEVLGTPIEACVDERGYFSLRVFYDSNEYAQKIELL